jgi:hypothetical protein
LNVVRINTSDAGGKNNRHEQFVPQEELNVETGEDEVEVEQQDYDAHNISGNFRQNLIFCSPQVSTMILNLISDSLMI